MAQLWEEKLPCLYFQHDCVSLFKHFEKLWCLYKRRLEYLLDWLSVSGGWPRSIFNCEAEGSRGLSRAVFPSVTPNFVPGWWSANASCKGTAEGASSKRTAAACAPGWEALRPPLPRPSVCLLPSATLHRCSRVLHLLWHWSVGPTAARRPPATLAALGFLSSRGMLWFLFFNLTKNLKCTCSGPLLFLVHLILFSGSWLRSEVGLQVGE